MTSTEPSVGWRVRRLPDGLVPAPAPRPVRPLVAAPRVDRLMHPRPPAVEPDDGLAAAASRMRRASASVLPVLESGRLVGVITERDVLLAVAERLSTDVLCVRDYMRAVPCVVGPEASAAEAAARMLEQRACDLLVVREGEVVGLLSAGRLLRELSAPRAVPGDERDDRFV